MLENYDLNAARRLGIRVIYQQLNAIEFLTVEENLALGQEESRFGFIRKRFEATEASSTILLNHSSQRQRPAERPCRHGRLRRLLPVPGPG